MTRSVLSFEADVLLWLAVLIVFFGMAAYLVLPRPLREASRQCAYRRDGTGSRRRRRIERACRSRFAVDAMVVIVLSSLPLLFSAFVIHQWIVPADLAITAMGRFHPDPGVFRERLEDDVGGNVRDAHSEWAERSNFSSASAQAMQATAWHAWPIVAVGMLSLSAVSLWFLVTAIKRLVKRFQQSLVRRLREYQEVDLLEGQRRQRESAG